MQCRMNIMDWSGWSTRFWGYQEWFEDGLEHTLWFQIGFGSVELGLHGADTLFHLLDGRLQFVYLTECLLHLIEVSHNVGKQAIHAEASVHVDLFHHQSIWHLINLLIWILSYTLQQWWEFLDIRGQVLNDWLQFRPLNEKHKSWNSSCC